LLDRLTVVCASSGLFCGWDMLSQFWVSRAFEVDLNQNTNTKAFARLGYGLAIKFVAYGQPIGAQMAILIVAGLGVGLSLAVPLIIIQAVSIGGR
jgi:hypothetical protein